MPEKIRVLHVVPSLQIGGLEKMVVDTAMVLNKQIFDSYIYCTCKEKDLEFFHKLFQKNLPEVQYGRSDRTLNWQAVKDLKNYIKEKEIDIVHSHAFEAYSVARIAAKLAKKKSVTTLHNTHQWHFTNNLKDKAKRTVSKLSAKFATDLMIADSIRIKNHYISILGYPEEKIEVLLNPVDTDYFHIRNVNSKQIRTELDIPGNAIVLANIAKLSTQKNQTFLIDCIAEIKENNQNIYLLIAGDGPNEQELKNRINEKQVQDRVKLLGPRSDIRELLGASDLFVLSSKWEGLPISLLEAMAMELPSLITDVGGISEIIDHGQNGLFYDISHPGDFVESLGKLVNNKGLRKKIGENSRQTVSEKCSLSGYIEKLATYYQSLCVRN